MKSILDPSFRYTSSVQTDVGRTFDRIRRELRAREKPDANSQLGQSKVLLECDSQLIDIESVDAVGIREPVPGVELVKFICPRCHQRHESLRFR